MRVSQISGCTFVKAVHARDPGRLQAIAGAALQEAQDSEYHHSLMVIALQPDIVTNGMLVRVQVLPGARVPADGQVVEGRSYVDESMVTGESRPVSKFPGQAVVGGTVNNSNVIVMKVCLSRLVEPANSVLAGQLACLNGTRAAEIIPVVPMQRLPSCVSQMRCLSLKARVRATSF